MLGDPLIQFDDLLIYVKKSSSVDYKKSFNISNSKSSYLQCNITIVYPNGQLHKEIKHIYLKHNNIKIKVDNHNISKNENKNVLFLITNPYSNKTLTNVKLKIVAKYLNLIETIPLNNILPNQTISVSKTINLSNDKPNSVKKSIISAQITSDNLLSPLNGFQVIKLI
jgi:hypothetical protein